MTTTSPRLDPGALARHITSMYRDVANETGHDLHFHTGRALAGALGYPADPLDRLPASAVSSFAGVGYPLGLARVVAGERVLDLGSDSGVDVFATAVATGPTARAASDRYGAETIELLAVKPTQETSK